MNFYAAALRPILLGNSACLRRWLNRVKADQDVTTIPNIQIDGYARRFRQ